MTESRRWMCAGRGLRWDLLAMVLCCCCAALSLGEEDHRYVVHHDAVTFEAALHQCSLSRGGEGEAGGTLTTLATQQEVQAVLDVVVAPAGAGAGGGGSSGHHNFWVGLRKANTDCVVPHLPLKGFKWTADGSESTQVPGGYRWRKEPPETCGLRCLLLSVESREDWALADSSCRSRHPFICKYDAAAPATPTAETGDGHQEETMPDLATTSLPPATTAPLPHPDDTPTADILAVTSSVPEQPTQPPPPPPPPPPSSSSSSQPHQPHPDPGLQITGDCRDAPVVNGSRSLRQHPDQPGRMTVECWSGHEVELNCSAATTGGRWEVVAGGDGGGALLLDRRLDDVCARCDAGYEKDEETWTCRDVDECERAPCGAAAATAGLGCVNTAGSYRCVCYDAQGAPHDPGAAACVPPDDGAGGAEVEPADHTGAQSGILIPALIAAAVVLLLLAVGAAVAVRCCLARRDKKDQAAEKEDVDKMAMDATAGRDKDAMETANEKEAM